MLITLTSFVNPLEAYIVQGRLETEGVPTYMANEQHIWANWFISNALGGVRLQVSDKYFLEAEEILKKINSGEYENELEQQQGVADTTKCPDCGSENIIECRWNEKVALLLFWAFAMPLPYIQGQLECHECKHQWVSKNRKMYSVFVRGFAVFSISLFYILLIKGYFYICKMQGNTNCY